MKQRYSPIRTLYTVMAYDSTPISRLTTLSSHPLIGPPNLPVRVPLPVRESLQDDRPTDKTREVGGGLEWSGVHRVDTSWIRQRVPSVNR